MKTKILAIILVILIIAITVGIGIANNKSKEYDNQINNYNIETTQLQNKEKKYTELIEQKDELINNTRKEILDTKKGSNLTELQDEKTKLINEIREL